MLPPVSDDKYSYWHNMVLANDSVYSAGEWALDVSRGTLDGSSMIRGIPPHLIRIDPASQAVVTPETLTSARGFFSADELDHGVGMHVRWMMEGTSSDHIINVQQRSRNQTWDREVIARLHRHGLALPV